MGRLSRYEELANAKSSYLGPDIKVEPVPSPIGGWDAISPLANMEARYAVVLDNWVPRPGWIELRGGYNTWCNTETGGPINSLLVYRPSSGTERMFAASGTAIYETTDNGSPQASKTGITDSKIQYCNFTPAGNTTYLVCCNGSDSVLNFNGTVWSTPSITNVTSSNLIQVTSHMRRLWFVEKNTTKVWYLPTDAISGAATALDVGSMLTYGSYVIATSTWTVDGGNGPNALFVILSNKGQAVIYQGVDPSASDTWNIVGVFDLPSPIGRRCLKKIGSDVAVITNSGLLPISKALPFNPASQRQVAFTNRIQNAMLSAAQSYSNQFGWEVELFPAQTLMIMNVPTVANSQQLQFVMNAMTGAWCKFTGWNANTFCVFNEQLYFGDNLGNVNVAYTGPLDLLNPIVYDMKCAFNFFNEPGRIKNMSMARPYLIADGTITPTLSVDVDFADNSPSAEVTTLTPTGGVWGTAIWDTSTWSTGVIAVNNWLSTNALGTALALRMKVNFGGVQSSQTSLGAFDVGVFDSAIYDGSGYTISGQGIPTLQVAEFSVMLQYGGPI